MKPPKEGSSKRKVWDVFQSKGAEAASKLSVPVGAGTVRSWLSEWTRNAGGTAPAAPKREPKTSQVKREKLPEKIKSDECPYPFKYTSRPNADLGIVGLCKRNGQDLRMYHTIEQDGRFAIVPASYKPKGPIPQFAKGDIVYSMVMSNSKAKVIDAGPETSVIKYMGPPKKGLARPDTEAISNVYLLKFEGKASKTKGKSPTRERL